MALPRNVPFGLALGIKGLAEKHADLYVSEFWQMLKDAQDDAGRCTVEYHRGRYFFITPSHFFFRHHEPSPSDCTWMVPK